LKIVKSSNFDEIWYTTANLELDGMCSHDSGEKFGQPGASFGAQVLQEFLAL